MTEKLKEIVKLINNLSSESCDKDWQELYLKIKGRELDKFEQEKEGDNLKLATFIGFYRYPKGDDKHFDYLKEQKKIFDLMSRENVVSVETIRNSEDKTIKNKKISQEQFNFCAYLLSINFIMYIRGCNDCDIRKNFTDDALEIYNKLLLKAKKDKTIYPGISENSIIETTKSLKEILEKTNKTEYKEDIKKLDTNLLKFESNNLSSLGEGLEEEKIEIFIK